MNDVQVNLVAAGEWDHPPGREDLDRATRRIATATFPGVVDRFDESLVAAEYALRTVFPALSCAQPPANVSRPPSVPLAARLAKVKEACGPPVYEQLVKLNTLDYELLERAPRLRGGSSGHRTTSPVCIRCGRRFARRSHPA